MESAGWKGLGLIGLACLVMTAGVASEPVPGLVGYAVMLLRPDVQRDLGMSAAQSSAVVGVIESSFRTQSTAPMDAAEQRRRQARADAEVLRMLSPSQQSRARQVWRRTNGWLALTVKDEARDLRLSEAQLRDLERAIDAYRAELRQMGQVGARQRTALARYQRQVEALLTKDQRAEFRRRQGPPIKGSASR